MQKAYSHHVLVWSLLLGHIAISLALGTQHSSRKVVVVGGGVGGLATACRLAASFEEPLDITILEKNSEIGGRCGSFNVSITGYGTFRHERGPSLLLLPDVYKKLFDDCGKSPEEYGLGMVPCNPAYQVVFEDGDNILIGYRRESNDVLSKGELVSRSVMDGWEDDGSRKFDAYMEACQAFLDCGFPNFIEERLDLPSFPSFIREALRDWARAWPLKPHSDVLDAYFDTPKMRALASFQDLYVGLEPYRNEKQIGGGVFQSTAPAVFGLLSAIELHPTSKKCGVYAPIGGFDSVSRAMKRLCEDLGIKIQCNQTVAAITESGVILKDTGEQLDADLVICNADLSYAEKSLQYFPEEKGNEKLERFDWEDRYRFSSGVLAFHWSISKELHNLNTHNVFMMAGTESLAKQSWRCIREDDSSPYMFDKDDPCNFYVHRPTKVDSTAAPKGCDSILVLLPTPTLKRIVSMASADKKEVIDAYKMQFPQRTIDTARELILQRLAKVKGLENLQDFIVDEVVDSPATMADSWNVGAGTPFGLSHGFAQLSLTRPLKASNFPENTLFVGASSRPGNGVPLVLVGAEQTANRAAKRLSQLSNALERSR